MLVQRGAIITTTCDVERGDSNSVGEYWLVKPAPVEAATASCILAGIRKGSHDRLCLDDPASVALHVQGVSSLTLMPICDAASANICLLKRIGSYWEEGLLSLHSGYEKILLWTDTCGIHGHHRAKMQVHGLQTHASIHYGLAKLLKLAAVQRDVSLKFEKLVLDAGVRRLIGPAPVGVLNLELITRVIFDVDAAYHLLRTGKKCNLVQEVQELASFLNYDWESGSLVHHCWCSSTNRPCCSDDDDMLHKLQLLCANGCFGRSDPLPAQSRWTNTLRSFKTTLFRRFVLGGAGVKVFPKVDLPSDPDPGIQEGLDSYFKRLNGVRKHKVGKYMSDESNFAQLVVALV